MKTYHTHFWRDGLWALLLVGIMGLAFYLAGLIPILLLIFGTDKISFVTDKLNLSVFVIFGLLFIFSGQAIMYAFWVHAKGTVVFNTDSLTYRYPKFICFFLYRNLAIRYRDILRIACGPVVLKGIYPDSLTKINKLAYEIFSKTTITIIYKQKNKIGNISLPIIHHKDYYQEFKKLIADLELKETDLGFVFERKV